MNELNARQALSELTGAPAELAAVCDREVPDFASTWHAIASNAQMLAREPALLASQDDVAALLASIVSLLGYHPGGFTEAYIVRPNFDEQVAENSKFDLLKERVFRSGWRAKTGVARRLTLRLDAALWRDDLIG